MEPLAKCLYYVVITWGSVNPSATFPAKTLLELLWRLQNAPNPGMSPYTGGFSALSPHPNLYLHVHMVLEKPCSPQTQMLRTLFQGKISGSSINTYRRASPCSLPLLPSVPCPTFLSFLWGSFLHFIRLLSGSDNSSASFPALSMTGIQFLFKYEQVYCSQSSIQMGCNRVSLLIGFPQGLPALASKFSSPSWGWHPAWAQRYFISSRCCLLGTCVSKPSLLHREVKRPPPPKSLGV